MTKDPVDTATDFASISSQYSYVTNDNITTNLISSVTNTITGGDTKTVNYTYTYDSAQDRGPQDTRQGTVRNHRKSLIKFPN